MKKVFLCVVGIILLFALTGCTPKSVTVGKYYLDNSNDAYIEIINETEIAFVNVEFPEVAAGLFDIFGEVNITERLASTYEFANKSDLYIFVKILDMELDGEPYPMALRLNYSKKDRAISTTDQVFVLK